MTRGPRGSSGRWDGHHGSGTSMPTLATHVDIPTTGIPTPPPNTAMLSRGGRAPGHPWVGERRPRPTLRERQGWCAREHRSRDGSGWDVSRERLPSGVLSAPPSEGRGRPRSARRSLENSTDTVRYPADSGRNAEHRDDYMQPIPSEPVRPLPRAPPPSRVACSDSETAVIPLKRGSSIRVCSDVTYLRQ